ncbi:adenylate cyclase type 9-like isoform X2 [Lineus longissimus]|uniref:adenylate cyclase type 9-like isoform X2 n=1 Tax=Lineus longissimus TaxID=88925 RepID=UPI002B4C479C
MADEKFIEGTVEYAKTDPEKVEVEVVRSPSKNRLKGTRLGSNDSGQKSQRPILFERAARTWWNPQFDSKKLEAQHQKSSFPQTLRRFQYAMFYIIASCTAWGIFFACTSGPNWVPFVVCDVIVIVVTILVVIFTYTRFYQRFMLPVSLVISLFLCALLLGSFAFKDPDLSHVWVFTGSVEIIIMMYTVIPMPFYVSVIIGVIHSVVFEVLSAVTQEESPVNLIIGKILLHLCIHLVGIHICMMSQVRVRNTFWKVGQSIMSRRDLSVEKQIKEKMIHSLMPPSVAAEAMKSRDDKEEEPHEVKRSRKKNNKKKGEIRFRAFNMHRMEKVSILFADIVGFTKMSSNKTAEHLVSLLNDLFGRFDKICTKSGCEKITTLGDCYYCVSGCPEARPDHAKCCVRMGLAMIKAIQKFDEDNNEEVNMRVGVHTGTVLCGIVGTKRFKFDVFSNDVTFANFMESSGQPGRVHISEFTYKCLDDEYEVDPGQDVKDDRVVKVLTEDYDASTNRYTIRHVQDDLVIKTYFIIGRKPKVGSTSDSRPQSFKDDFHDDSASEDGSEQGKGDVNNENAAALLHRRGSEFGSDEALANEQKDTQENGGVMMPSVVKQMQEMNDQTDKQLIKCIEEDTTSQEYFYKPPINQCTLNFINPDLEWEYRDHYLEDDMDTNIFAAPRFSAMLDMIVSLLIFVMISICCFIGFEIQISWIIVFVMSLILELLCVTPLILHICFPRVMNFESKFAQFLSNWYPRHFLGVLISSIPVAAVYSNFSCVMFTRWTITQSYFCYLIVTALMHYCNFTMYSMWMKSVLATVAGIILVILLGIGVCQLAPSADVQMLANFTTPLPVYSTVGSNLSDTVLEQLFHGQHALRFEAILDMLLILLLVWFLNREFEITYRLGFHGDVEAANDRMKMEDAKEQADWLLHNIIPEHVSEQLKLTSKYSRNHKHVGVIFACITNFDEMYDESFEGGLEFLRVLNELVADFEELLNLQKYKDVEKIKTISSTFMAASGLNEQSRAQNKMELAHLYALMEFSNDMLKVMERFNESIFNFDFILKIGYNTGEVTAGVIGTTKLLFDIWGDTVNVASRMYSTGCQWRIQVTKDVSQQLSDMFEFEYRGPVFVKGKGDLETFLMVKKKDDAHWE